MKALGVCVAVAVLTAPAFAATGTSMSPTDALGYPGIEVTVQGPASVRHPPANYDGQDAALVGLGSGDNGAVVLAYIRNADIGKFPNLQALDGRIVDISGVVEMDNGQAEIRLESPDQIAVAR